MVHVAIGMVMTGRRDLARLASSLLVANLGILLLTGTLCRAETLPVSASGIVKLVQKGAAVDTNFARQDPDNAIVLSGAGPLVSFCPPLACVTSPTPDHQRAAALFAAVTGDDGHSEEQTVAVTTTVKTGLLRTWAPRRRFAVGESDAFLGARNAIYRVIAAGVSAPDGSGPEGKGADIADGSVRWRWINDAAIGAKVGIYNELATVKGGGASWGQANNVHLQSGATPSFNVNSEFDFVNDAAECAVGAANCNNIVVATGGRFRSTSGLQLLSENAATYATHWGLRLSGTHLASDADLEEDADALVGIGIGVFDARHHEKAGIVDASTGGASFLVTGDHGVATIKDVSSSPASIDVGGRHKVAGILEQSRSRSGLALNGQYAEAQVVGKGFVIDPDGNLSARSLTSSASQVVPFGGPPTSRSLCRRGEVRVSEDFIYSCVADDRWRRATLSDS